MTALTWQKIDTIPSRSYKCSYCGRALASEKGWTAQDAMGQTVAFIYICHQCNKPTFIEGDGTQYPGILIGNLVDGIPDDSVKILYDEARSTAGAGNYTASILCCRKLLMHIAVNKGAKPGDNFLAYVQFLAENHYIPPDAREWVDHIRQKGNEANHEIKIMSKEDAENLVSFVEMLLKIIFEFPSVIKRKTDVILPKR
jgi:DNA-directed RNA polymerase subunit RPC12/RpoP